jgi:hypothetical protein
MIKNSTLRIMMLLVCLPPASALCQNKLPPQDPPVLTFGDLKRNDGIEGPFRIRDAYVIEIYKCPPCPPGAQCKPCLGDYIVVTNKLDEKDPLLVMRLRIFTGGFGKFELKEKCSLLTKVRGNIPKGKPIQDLDLLLEY